MRILLAEDDMKLGNLLKHLLEKAEVQADWVTRGDVALEYALHSAYDVIVLDWMMPGYDGIYVCERLRKTGYQGAILMLTAKDAVEDRVLGLDTGADDYLVKPFEFIELLARVRALARRSSAKIKEDILHLGNLVLNRTTRIVRVRDDEIQLSSREYQLLDLLAQNKGQVVPRDVIIDRIWGLDADVSSNNLDAHVRLLRRKIDSESDDVVIQNVRGIGFKLEVHDVQSDA